MRRIPAALALTALAVAIPAALAQEVTGSVSVTGISSRITGDNPFRFLEYRDLDDGATAGMDLRMRSDAWWHNLFGENLGRDDQYVLLRGGRYGIFKYGVYGDDIIHNLTFGAITPWSGVGSNNLTFTPPISTDTATWNRFDYGLQHKNIGGFAEVQPMVDSPFYVRVTTNRKRTEGIRPVGGTGGSPGGPAYELQAPIDWTTTDFSGEAGYSTKNVHFSVSAMYSKFEDHNDFLNWRTPAASTGATTEWTTLSSDNELMRIGANAMWKQLPMGSSLAVRATYTKLETSQPVQTTWLVVTGTPPAGVVRLANPSDTHWDGEVVNKSISAALNSHLARDLDSKIYYNWYERKNNSHHVVFLPSGPGSGGGCDFTSAGVAVTPAQCTTEFLHFERNNFGAEVQYRLNRENKITGGIDYLDIERERIDFDRTKETKLSLEWKSTSLGFADARVKYQRLQRDSDFLLGDRTSIFDRYVYRFDAAPLDRDLVKLAVDSSPAQHLDLGAELILKRNKYKDTVLGRTKDTREEIYLTASYGDPAQWRVTAFADWEHTRYDSTHWVGATTTFPDPNPAGTTYLWQAEVTDRNHLVGVGVDWPINERLKVKGAAIWQKTDGMVDFATPNNFGNPVNIDAYDSFDKRSLNVKAIYAATRQIEVSVGAAYEKYDFSDVQIDGYIYALRTGTTQHLLSGAYAFPSYKATVVYATVAYRF